MVLRKFGSKKVHRLEFESYDYVEDSAEMYACSTVAVDKRGEQFLLQMTDFAVQYVVCPRVLGRLKSTLCGDLSVDESSFHDDRYPLPTL